MRNLQLISRLDEHFNSIYSWNILDIYFIKLIIFIIVILFCIIKIFLIAEKIKWSTLKSRNILVKHRMSLLKVNHNFLLKKITFLQNFIKIFMHDIAFYRRLTIFSKALTIDIVYRNTNFIHYKLDTGSLF